MSFLANISKSHILAAMLLLSAATALLGQDAGAWLRNSVQWVFAPTGDAGMYLTTWVKGSLGTEDQSRLTPAEVQKLRKERDFYRSLVLENYRQLIEQNRLREQQRPPIFGETFRAGIPCRLIEGRVIARDSLPYGRNRAINIGQSQGADVGSFATTRLVALPTSKALPTEPPPPAILRSHLKLKEQVLVGRVVEAWAFGARIQLVTDRGFTLPANVERLLYPDRDRYYTDLESGQRRLLKLSHNPPVPILLEGDGAQGLIAAKIPDNYNIEPGDEIVTQDDRYFLPARVRVARITEVVKQPRQPGYVTLKAEPLADLPAMRDIFVVYPEYRRAQPGP